MSLKGTVIRYDRKRGFGFIKPADEGGKHLFIHWRNINSSEPWPSLKRGMEVLYDTKVDDERRGEQKEVACNVTDVDGSEIKVMQEDIEERNLSKPYKGTVKFFAKQGYGFIECDTKIIFGEWKLPAGSDVYVSREELIVDEESICTLAQGMRVQFKLYEVEGEENLRAAEVSNEDGSALHFEPREKGERKGERKGKGKGGKKGKGKGKAVEETSSKGKAKGKGKVKAAPTKTFSSSGVRSVQKALVVKPMTTTKGAATKGKSKGKGKK